MACSLVANICCVTCFGSHNYKSCVLKPKYAASVGVCYMCGLPSGPCEKASFHKSNNIGRKCDAAGRDLLLPLGWAIWRGRSERSFQFVLKDVECHAETDQQFRDWLCHCKTRVKLIVFINKGILQCGASGNHLA